MERKLTHSIEDYLEMIYVLSQDDNQVRITDLAEKMKLRKSSIVSAVKKLKMCGFVQHQPYCDIILTKEGIKRASEIYQKHVILKTFFMDILRLPESIAEKDACNFEHYISDQTVKAIIRLAEKLSAKKEFMDNLDDDILP